MKKTLFILLTLFTFVFVACNDSSKEDSQEIIEDNSKQQAQEKDEENFSCSDDSSVVDGILTDNRDNQTYKTAKIGEQCWMAENLNYDNGCTDILWVNDSREGWCGCYENDSENCKKYGLLYQWTAAMNETTGEGSQGICPDGWHIPSDEEWKNLEIFLGMTQEDAEIEGSERNSGDVKSKLINTNHKGYSGFAALPGGYRVGDGDFRNIGSIGYFVTSTATKVDNAWRRSIDWYESGIDRRVTSQAHSFSVRCVRD